ncbi:hypothetical protein K7432_002000 [Basidiobolus ranarum]|uniref:Serine/threonine-protein phosphatase 1 regulatory subunit 10 n=1 Tax=Basidiobolus ranarum TaxID=34480 RepID=A0ABR2X255_9FUNG
MNNWNNQFNDGHIYQQPELDSIYPASGASFDSYIIPFHPISMPLTMQTSLLSENGGGHHAIAFSPNSILGVMPDLTTSLDPGGLSSFQQPDTPRTRGRMIYTQGQIEELETAYRTSERYGYPSKQIKSDLANTFGCSEAQINTWFSRRRGKDSQVKGKPEYIGVLGDRGSDSGTNTPEPVPLNYVTSGGNLITSQSTGKQEWASFNSSISNKAFENTNITDPRMNMMRFNEPLNRPASPLNESQPNNDWSSMMEVVPVKTEGVSIMDPPNINYSSGFELDYLTDLHKDNEAGDASNLCDFLEGIETLEAQRHSHGAMNTAAYSSPFQGISDAPYGISLPPLIGSPHASNLLHDWTTMVPGSNMSHISHPVNNFEIASKIAIQSAASMANSNVDLNPISTKPNISLLPSQLKTGTIEGPKIDLNDVNVKKDMRNGSVFNSFESESSTLPALNPNSILRLESMGNGASYATQPYPAASVNIGRFSSIPTSTPIAFPHNWGNLNLINHRAIDYFQNYQNATKVFNPRPNFSPFIPAVRPKYVVEVIVPPPRKDLPLDNDPGIMSGATTPKEENADELMHLLTPLVNKDWGLGHVDHIPKFVKLMRNEEQLMSRSLLLTVLVNTTDRTTLKSFSNSKGPTVLRMWIVQAQKESSPMLIKLLEALSNIPMDIDTLKETMLGRVIKTLKNSENEDVKKLAIDLMDRWTKLIQQEASTPGQKKRPRENGDKPEADNPKNGSHTSREDNQKKSRPEKPSNPGMAKISKFPHSATLVKTSSLKLSESSGPIKHKKDNMAVTNVDFFNNLSATSLPKINKVRPNATVSKLGTRSSSKSKNNSFSPLDALLPKILSRDGNNSKRKDNGSHNTERRNKTSRIGSHVGTLDLHPSMRPDSESVLKPGTKKKRVSFAPDHALVQIREFKTQVEEPSITVMKEWEKPLCILLEFNVVQRGENSNEVFVQQEREIKVLSAVYFSEGHIPDTPNEPEEDIRESSAHQVKAIPLYDVGSEAFQLSQLLSQVQAAAPISAPVSLQSQSIETTSTSTQSWDRPSNTSTSHSWKSEFTQSWSQQDPPYNPDEPDMDISNQYTSDAPHSAHPNSTEEQGYDPYQDYPQDSREEYDPSYQSYGNDYERYNDNEGDEQQDYNSGYEEEDRRWRFGSGRKHYRGGRGRGRGGPNRGGRWGPGRDHSGIKSRIATAPCKFFAEGSCRYGDKCRFSHDLGRGR